MAERRLTILADSEQDKDLIGHLEANGLTKEGRRYLRIARILDRAGVADPLTMLMENGRVEKFGEIAVIEMALNMAEIMNGEEKKKEKAGDPEPLLAKSKKRPPIFGAGDPS